MPQFFPLSPYPFTAVASTSLLVGTTGVAIDLTNITADLNKANVLLIQNAGPETVYFNYAIADASAPTFAGQFPDGDQGILSGAIMTFPIAPTAGSTAFFYTLSDTSTVLISRGWGS